MASKRKGEVFQYIQSLKPKPKCDCIKGIKGNNLLYESDKKYEPYLYWNFCPLCGKKIKKGGE